MKRMILIVARLLGISSRAGAVPQLPKNLNPCLKGKERHGAKFDELLSQFLEFAKNQLSRPTFYGVEPGNSRVTAALVSAYWDTLHHHYRNAEQGNMLPLVFGCADFMVDFPRSSAVPSEHRALMNPVREAHTGSATTYANNLRHDGYSEAQLRAMVVEEQGHLREYLASDASTIAREAWDDELRAIMEEERTRSRTRMVSATGDSARSRGRSTVRVPGGRSGVVGVGAVAAEAAEAEAVGAARGTGKLGGRAITAIALSLGAYDLIKRSDAAFASGQKKGQTVLGTLGRSMVASALDATLGASAGNAQAAHNSFKTQEATLERNLCRGSFAPGGAAYDLSYVRMMMVSDRIACTVRALAEKTAEGKPVLQNEDPKTLEIAQTLWAHYAQPKTAYSKSTSPGAALQCYWSSFDPKKPSAKTSFKPTRVADLCQTKG